MCRWLYARHSFEKTASAIFGFALIVRMMSDQIYSSLDLSVPVGGKKI